VAFLERKYRVSTGQFGLAVIEVMGRCTDDEVAEVEADCTRRFELVPIPNASGAIFKSMDGSLPKTVKVEPSTFDGKRYTCVKVDGRCNPLAPEQSGGSYNGKAVLRFVERYQEVGGVS